MEITKKQRLVAGIALLIAIIVAGALWQGRTTAPTIELPASGFSAFTATTTLAPARPAGVAPASVATKFPLNPADTIVSWSFKGAYTGNDALVAKANADIAHLTGLIGKGQYDDYDLYLGIGNDADLLGDGALAYQNYNHSISIHPKKGLAYDNLGHLMDELGAYHTAADAYAKAVAVEPGQMEYHIERLKFLTRAFPTDSARILAAFTDSANVFGDNASILAIEAQWLTGQKRYADAIAAWERAKLLSPGKNTSAIDAEIARLKAKQ